MRAFARMRWGAVVTGVVAACTPAGWSPLEATCGAAGCLLVTGTAEGLQPKGSMLVDVSFRYVDQDRLLEGSHRVGEVLTPKIDFEEERIEPDHHREIRTQNSQLRLDLVWGAAERLTLAASLPLVDDRDHGHFDEVGTPEEHFTRQDGASGRGNLRLGARFSLFSGAKDHFVGGLFVELPTGAYRLHDGEGGSTSPRSSPAAARTTWRRPPTSPISGRRTGSRRSSRAPPR